MIHTEILPVDVLRNLKVVDNGESLVDLRETCPGVRFEIAEYLRTPACKTSEYEDAFFVRETVAEMIAKVQGILPGGIVLVIRCGYRTPEVQQRQFDIDYAKMKQENPTWTKQRLDHEIESRTSSVDIAPHCTGGAIDLTLVESSGKQLDMGTKMGDFVDGTHTYSEEISESARANRRILLDAMTGAGFINFPGEWWHFSYGAREWTAYTGNQESCYDIVERRQAAKAKNSTTTQVQDLGTI
jgi:zinc D-Ala-D-Ala dipeptidase